MKEFFKKHPLLSVFYLLIACLIFRILDIFIFRLDEIIGEIIISKTIGFILVILFLYLIKKKLSYIYMHKSNLNLAIMVSLNQVLLALVMTFGAKYLFILFQDGSPYLTWSDEYTFITMISFVFIGNIINTLMEEGLFRGVLLKTFMTKMTFIKANLLQSFLFGLWHITWTIKEYTTGVLSFNEMLVNSLLYMIIAMVMGLIMGYMVYKTKSIWTPIIWHTIWNCTMNLVIIKSHVFNEESSVMNNSMIIFWLSFILYSILSVILLKRIRIQQIRNDS